MPITDVLQMIGRAGRPQYDHQGVAMVMVHDVKKGFYKKFLYEPFPVESSLLSVLADHLNAEIVAGTIQTRQGEVIFSTTNGVKIIINFKFTFRCSGLHDLDILLQEVVVESILLWHGGGSRGGSQWILVWSGWQGSGSAGDVLLSGD